MARTITLIRHGKVDIDTKKRLDSLGMQEWVKQYDDALLCSKLKPSQQTIKYSKLADFIYASQLQRTHDSADVLGIKIDEQDALFNEADIPTVKLPLVKLRPKTWLIILRLLLLLRVGKSNSSFQYSKQRAEKAAFKLMKKSEEYEHVVLIGHGGLNWLMAKVLKKNGWKLLAPASNKNWGLTRFSKA